MRDVVETSHIFFKLMEKFCNGSVVVQDKKKSQAKRKRGKKTPKPASEKENSPEEENVSWFA